MDLNGLADWLDERALFSGLTGVTEDSLVHRQARENSLGYTAAAAACRELANKRQECRCEEDGPGDSLEAATDAALAEISNG